MLWLWRRLSATAPIGPLAWEPPHVAGAALKRPKKKKKNYFPRVDSWKQNYWIREVFLRCLIYTAFQNIFPNILYHKKVTLKIYFNLNYKVWKKLGGRGGGGGEQNCENIVSGHQRATASQHC